MLPVAIVGGHWFASGNVFDNSVEVWAFNDGAAQKPHVDVVFQIHELERATLIGGEEHINWLKSLNVPIYMREKFPQFPTSIAYPFDEVFALTGHVKQGLSGLEDLRYLTSSVPFAIALAVLQNRPRIDIYGMELDGGAERKLHVDCITFWIGFAAGRNISLNIHCADWIFRRPIYGENPKAVFINGTQTR
jgi:hypothetical protein